MQFQFIKKKMCENKKCVSYDKLYIFGKPFATANLNVPKYSQNFLKLNFYSRKTKNVQILF